jgi:hypothetical protein
MKTRQKKNNLYRNFTVALLLVDVYFASLIVLAKPCGTINRAPDRSYQQTAELPGYPTGTLLCVSESPRVNAMAYWFYRPLGWFLECREVVHLVHDPTQRPSHRGLWPPSDEGRMR